MRKMLAFLGIALLLGAGLGLAQEKERTQVRNEVQNQTRTRTEDGKGVQARTETRTRKQIRFLDENGDGINDLLFRDDDGDGVPNGRDPDWTAPKDGSGYQMPAQAGARKGQAGLASTGKWTKNSFRTGMAGVGAGTGICDGTGPKGKTTRRGRG